MDSAGPLHYQQLILHFLSFRRPLFLYEGYLTPLLLVAAGRATGPAPWPGTGPNDDHRAV